MTFCRRTDVRGFKCAPGVQNRVLKDGSGLGHCARVRCFSMCCHMILHVHHQVLFNAMHLFQVAKDVPHLLLHHLAALLLVGFRLPQPLYVDPVGGVCPLAPFEVAPQISILVCICCQMMFHLIHGHL